jgi:hypothetical protein
VAEAVDEESVEAAGECSFDAAPDLSLRLTFFGSAFDVGASLVAALRSDEDSDVECRVGLSVAA